MNLRTDNWTDGSYSEFVELLKSLADAEYKKFHSSLVPTDDSDSFIGVRMPKMRELGKEISKGNPRSFLAVCKCGYYEEKMVRGIVVGLIKPKDFGDFTALADSQLPFICNWALCDCFCSGLKYVKKCRAEFFEHIKSRYLNSANPWKVRVALVLMLNYYLDDEYIDEVLRLTDGVSLDHYYVKMAQAWLIATAVAKCREQTLDYLKHANIPDDTFNKAVQKSVESFRVDDETKAYLKTLKKRIDK